MSDDPALSVRRALARVDLAEREDGTARASKAEARLRAALEKVTALDLEVERLSSALADFARVYERAVGPEHAELRSAERVIGELRTLLEKLLVLLATVRSGERGSRRRKGAHTGKDSAAARFRARFRSGQNEPEEGSGERPSEGKGTSSHGQAEQVPEVEPKLLRLKRIYRRLARLLHPDLAPSEEERVRLGELMAKVNAAYAKEDLTALEVMAEKVGAGEPPGDVSPEERLAHLERRAAAMERFAASLCRERDRLRRSDTFRLQEEAVRRAADGGNYFEETKAELAEEISAAWADASLRLSALEQVARDVTRARTVVMTEIARRGPTGTKRAFDPFKENEIVRAGVARLDRRRATAAARDLARHLENTVPEAPCEVALTLLAFFAEDSGGGPPEALSSVEGWTAVWDRLRTDWPQAPDLPRMLARLPRGLTVGARLEGETVRAGVQLEDGDLAAGVRMSLEHSGVAAIARRVLATLGPEERCPSCHAVGPTQHLLRTRGLDERHAFVCASCGSILRSFWRYGEVDGIEALNGLALRLGLVEEVTFELAGTSVGFQMLPVEREALTAAGLRKRFVDLYLTPYEIELKPGAVGIVESGKALSGSARVKAADYLRLVLEPGEGVPTAEELLELLRGRIERRFRP